MKFTCFFALLFLMFSTEGEAEPNDYAALEIRINALLSDFSTAGLSVGIVKNDQLAYAKGFGFRDVESQKPVTPETTFPIGSITKSFTSTLLGILESEEKISLKDQPAKYIPDFEFASIEMNRSVSISDLLSHRSGLGNQGTSEILFPDSDMLRVARRAKYLKPQAEVKESFAYSNMAYMLAAVVYEQVSNETWEKAVENRLFRPLDMDRTYTSLDQMKASQNYALPYGLYKEDLVRVKFEEFNSTRAAGAIKSNVTDLANWIRVWMSGGEFGGAQVIPKKFTLNATRLHNTKFDSYEADAYLQGEGLGWRLRSSYGKFRVAHGGNTFGFSSVVAMFPFDDLGVVVLTNQDNSTLPYIVLDMIVRLSFNLPAVANYPTSVTPIYKPDLKALPYNSEQPMSLALSEYTGAYYADGYGQIRVEQKENRLYLDFPNVRFHLEHIENDEFYMEGTTAFTGVYNPEFTVSFESKDSRIMELMLHSQSPPVTFSRVIL